MKNAAHTTQELVANCRHSKLRAALQMPGRSAATSTVVETATPAPKSLSAGFVKKAASLMLVACCYFLLASFAAVDYSAWETDTTSDEIAICQTTEDGRVQIVTVAAHS